MTTSFVLALTTLYANSANVQKNSGDQKGNTTHRATDVYLTNPHCSLGVEFSALWLQPTSSNLHYAAQANPLPAPTPNWKIHDIKPDYDWGFEVGIDAQFRGTRTDLMLNWTHFHSSDSKSVTVPTEDMLGPFFTIGPDASPYNSAHGKVRFHFDEANFDYGVLVNFGRRVRTNLFAGVSYVYLKQTLTSNFSSPDGTDTRSIKVPSKFSGAGPQLGFDFCCRLAGGFSFVGNTSGSLLVGTMKNHTTYESVSPLLGPLGITPPNTQNTSVSKRTQVVPGLEARLGLAYVLSCFTLEAGYQAKVFINAIQSVDMGSEVPLNSVEATTVGVYARSFQRNLSNFALAGPYARLQIRF